jgi:hypothetical protein
LIIGVSMCRISTVRSRYRSNGGAILALWPRRPGSTKMNAGCAGAAIGAATAGARSVPETADASAAAARVGPAT